MDKLKAKLPELKEASFESDKKRKKPRFQKNLGYTSQDHTFQQTNPSQTLQRTNQGSTLQGQTNDAHVPARSVTPANMEQLTATAGANSTSSQLQSMDFSMEFQEQSSVCPHCLTTHGPGQPCHTAGTMVGKYYEIISLLGEGGMGAVYKARHVLMKRIVALKVLHQRLTVDDITVRRFQKEAVAASKLTHPYIVKTHEFAIAENGLPFLVMDYAEGTPLSKVIQDQGTLSVDQMVRVISQICEALAHAHRHGVVHRDLKPCNVLLVPSETDPGELDVRVLDFGIAKIVEGEGSTEQLTQTGHALGSPVYMSPEQCRSKPTDQRADIYSLGCVIFEALTGKPPLVGSNVVETLYLQTHTMPPSVSTLRKNLKDVNRLDAIILKCMAKDPKDRYQSMDELRGDIQKLAHTTSWFKSVLGHGEILARRNSARVLLPHETRGFIVTFTAVTVVLCAAASFLLYQAYSGLLPSDSKSWEELYQEGQHQLDVGDLPGSKKSLFYALRKLLGSSASDPAVFLALCQQDIQSPALERAIVSKDDDGRIETTLNQLRDSFSMSGDLQTAAKIASLTSRVGQSRSLSVEQVNRALAELRNALDDSHNDDSLVEPIFNSKTDLALSSAPSANCEKLLGQMADLLRDKLGPENKLFARCLSNIGHYYLRGNDASRAKPFFERALAISNDGMRTEKGLTDDPVKIATRLRLMGVADYETGDYNSAIKYLTRAISVCRDDPLNNAVSRSRLAQTYFSQGKTSYARSELEGVLKYLNSDQAAGLPVDIATDLKAECNFLLAKVDAVEGEAVNNTEKLALRKLSQVHASQALRYFEQENRINFNLPYVLEFLAFASPQTADQTIRPEFLYRRALAILMRAPSRDDAGIARILNQLATTRSTLHPNERLASPSVLNKLYEQKLLLDKTTASKNQLFDDYKNLALFNRQSEQPDLQSSASHWQNALTLADGLWGASSPQSFECLVCLGSTYLDAGSDKAEHVLQRALSLMKASPVIRKECPKYSVELLQRLTSLFEKTNRKQEAESLRQEFAK